MFQIIKNLFKPKYYIYSAKHTEGAVRVFWKPNRQGYTIDLNEAGVYSTEDMIRDKKFYPLITSLVETYSYQNDGFDTFYVKKKDIEKVFRKKIVCVRN